MADLDTQQKYLYDLLSRDRSCNHQLLSYYLKLIISNRPVEVELPDKTTFVLSPEEAWKEINDWKDKGEISLPMGDSGSRKIKASRLLNYLEVIQGTTREAATNFQSILDSATHDPLKNATPSTEHSKQVKSMLDIRKLQLDIHNKQVLGQLATELEQTSYLKRFAGDKPTQIALAGLFAANAANLRNSNLPRLVMAEEITKLVQLNAGRTKDINNAAHLAYSNIAQEKELVEISNTINSYIKSNFKSEEEFTSANNQLSNQTHLLSVSDIPTILDLIAPNATSDTRKRLSLALQTTIIRSTDDYYTSGDTLLSRAFNLAGLPAKEADNLSSITPLLEEIRGTELHNTLSGDIKENDPRIQNTLNLAGDVGVSSHIPWLNNEDIDSRAVFLQKKYDTQNLAETLTKELSLGKNADMEKVSEIRHHLSDREQYRAYRGSVDGNISFYWRERFGKARGRIASATAPIDRFSQKINKKIENVDSFIQSPFRYLGDKLELLQENFPITQIVLNPGKLISSGQLWIAGKVLDWSTRVATSAVKEKRWYAGAFTQVAEFTRGFIHTEGDWGGASFHFVQKKWGNVLDWGAKKAGYAGWQGVKTSIGSSMWSGFAKLAPGMAEKLASGGFGKLVASLVAGELTAGTSLLLQAGLIVVWEGIKGIGKFLTDSAYRARFFDKLPAIISGISLAIGAIPGAIIAGLLGSGSALLAAMGSIITLLFSTIFVPALIAVGAMIFAFFLLFQTFNLTVQIDSGVGQLITSVICNENPEGAQKSTINTASCIVKILSDCGINPLNKGNANSSKWQCALASLVAQDAMEELKKSASDYHVLQCVGFVSAVDIAGGGTGSFPDAKNMDAIHPKNYNFVAGVGSCTPGDIFVDKNGAWGHTGIFLGVAGPVIKCIDANGGGPGVVRGESSCQWLTSKVAGCLKKI